MDSRDPSDFEYDFVISYASEDESHAQSLKDRLRARGARIFFAPDNQADMWGSSLPEYLEEIFKKKGVYCIPLISQYYVAKVWTRYEWRQALSRAISEIDSRYILPIRLDDAELPGLPDSTVYIDIRKVTIQEIARLVMAKLYGSPRLPSIVPENWLLVRRTDMDSRELDVYAWQVAIIDRRDKNIAGEFYVCSFITTGNHGSRRIALRIDTSYILALQKRVLPVLIHGYDSANVMHSWQWLDDPSVLSEIQSASRTKKRLQIKLPVKNSWSDRSVERIETKAYHLYQRHQRKQRAERSTLTDPNYSYVYQTHGNVDITSVHPKHQKSLENQPIEGNLLLSPDASTKLANALEMGEPTEFQGQVVLRGLPEWFFPNTDDPVRITIFPLVPNQSTIVRVEYFDENNAILLRSEAVEFRFVKFGSKLKEFQGISLTQPIVYTYVLNEKAQLTRFSVSYSIGSNMDPVDLDWYLDVLEKLPFVKRVELHNYQTRQSTSLVDYHFSTESPLSGPRRELIRYLATVSKRFNVRFTLPKRFTINELKAAELAYEILTTGRSHNVVPSNLQGLKEDSIPLLGITGGQETIDAIVNQIDEVGYAYVQQPLSFQIELFGQNLDFGLGQYIACCNRRLDEEISKKLSADIVDNRGQIATEIVWFASDLHDSYAYFPQWLQDGSEAQTG